MLANITATILCDQYSLVATGLIAVAAVGLFSLLAVSPAGDLVCLLSTGVRRPTREELNFLKPIFDEVYRRSGMQKKIWLYISGDNFPNGQAMGTNIIAVSPPLLTCPAEEIKAVLAHELGHIKNRDTHIIAVCCILDRMGVAALAVAIGIILFLTEEFKIFLPFLIFVVMLKIIQVILNALIKLVYLSTRRGMEFQADAFAASLGYRQGMIGFLNRIGDTRIPFFVIFDTHPLSKKRIAALTLC